MQTYNKIHLISDIHGYYQGLLMASQLTMPDCPLFVLGDLFDHQYGLENKIIDLLLELNERNSLVLITGNHDVVINLAFNRSLNDEEAIYKLTKEKNLKKFKIFKTIFDEEFYSKFLKLREGLLEANVSDGDKLVRYYNNISKLAQEPKYIERYIKVQKLMDLFVDYAEVEVNNHKLLLSHSGNITDPFSRDTAKPYFKLDNKYDYGVMGHLTIPKISQMILEEGDMLNFEDNFELNYKLNKLKIDGEYMYNHHSKMIMIDNGSHENVVTIY